MILLSHAGSGHVLAPASLLSIASLCLSALQWIDAHIVVATIGMEPRGHALNCSFSALVSPRVELLSHGTRTGLEQRKYFCSRRNIERCLWAFGRYKNCHDMLVAGVGWGRFACWPLLSLTLLSRPIHSACIGLDVLPAHRSVAPNGCRLNLATRRL